MGGPLHHHPHPQRQQGLHHGRWHLPRPGANHGVALLHFLSPRLGAPNPPRLSLLPLVPTALGALPRLPLGRRLLFPLLPPCFNRPSQVSFSPPHHLPQPRFC